MGCGGGQAFGGKERSDAGGFPRIAIPAKGINTQETDAGCSLPVHKRLFQAVTSTPPPAIETGNVDSYVSVVPDLRESQVAHGAREFVMADLPETVSPGAKNPKGSQSERN